jgi:hypothetical protein
MIQGFPYHIRRSADGYTGELLLRLGQGKTALIVHLSLEQARRMAVEMRGLATDHVTMVILKGLSRSQVIDSLRLETETDSIDIDADVAAALGMAIHLGLPISMEGSHTLSQDELAAIQGPVDSLSGAQVPDAFLKVIEGLDFPPDGDG